MSTNSSDVRAVPPLPPIQVHSPPSFVNNNSNRSEFRAPSVPMMSPSTPASVQIMSPQTPMQTSPSSVSLMSPPMPKPQLSPKQTNNQMKPVLNANLLPTKAANVVPNANQMVVNNNNSINANTVTTGLRPNQSSIMAQNNGQQVMNGYNRGQTLMPNGNTFIGNQSPMAVNNNQYFNQTVNSNNTNQQFFNCNTNVYHNYNQFQQMNAWNQNSGNFLNNFCIKIKIIDFFPNYSSITATVPSVCPTVTAIPVSTSASATTSTALESNAKPTAVPDSTAMELSKQ